MSEQDFHKIKNRNLAVFIDLFEKMLKKDTVLWKTELYPFNNYSLLIPFVSLTKNWSTLLKQAIIVRYGHLGFFLLLEVLDDLTFLHDNQTVAVFEGILHLVGNHEGRQLVSADKVVS